MLKIKSKTKNNKEGRLQSLSAFLRKLQRHEIQQGMSSVSVKYRAPKMVLHKELSSKVPLEPYNWNINGAVAEKPALAV